MLMNSTSGCLGIREIKLGREGMREGQVVISAQVGWGGPDGGSVWRLVMVQMALSCCGIYYTLKMFRTQLVLSAVQA
jgi:hypothetical protein